MAVIDFIRNPRVRRFPDLTFYYGIPPNELKRTKNYLLDLYIAELPRLQAEQRQWMALTSLYGAAEADEFREKVDEYLNQFLPMVDPGGESSAEALRDAGVTNPEDHAAMLAAMGISMIIEDGVPKKPPESAIESS